MTETVLAIGTPAALSNALNPLAGTIIMMMLAKQGTEAVAAYGAAQRIESILIIVLMSLTSALRLLLIPNFSMIIHSVVSREALFLSMRFAVLFQGLIS